MHLEFALTRRLIDTTGECPSTPTSIPLATRRRPRTCQIGKAVVDLISSIESSPVTLYISTSEIRAW